jgi:hypothetical protein
MPVNLSGSAPSVTGSMAPAISTADTMICALSTGWIWRMERAGEMSLARMVVKMQTRIEVALRMSG